MEPFGELVKRISNWRGAVVTERQGEVTKVNLAAHVFVMPGWLAWLDVGYQTPLDEIRPSFHVRDGQPEWDGGGFKLLSSGGREVCVVAFDPELHQARSEAVQAFADWLASEDLAWQEEWKLIFARVQSAISRVKSKHPYAIQFWDFFWGALTAEPGSIDRSSLEAEVEDEIGSLQTELDTLVMPIAWQVKAVAQGRTAGDLMDEMLSATYSDRDLASADWLEAQIRTLVIAVSAANRLLEEGCHDDARAAARGARRVMQLTRGHLTAVKAGRKKTVSPAAKGVRAKGKSTKDRVREAAPKYMAKGMSRQRAAPEIAKEIKRATKTVQDLLTVLFPGDDWKKGDVNPSI